MGSVRVLRIALALVLGTAAAPGDHPARPARRTCPGRAKADERQVLLDILDDEDLAGHGGQACLLLSGLPGLVFGLAKSFRLFSVSSGRVLNPR
jgi:hypothetical protein